MSKKWSLNINDFWNGLAVSILSAVIISLQEMIKSGGLGNINLNAILTVSIVALLGYLGTHLAVSSNGKILK